MYIVRTAGVELVVTTSRRAHGNLGDGICLSTVHALYRLLVLATPSTSPHVQNIFSEMSTEFSFKDFCKENALPDDTIAILTKEHYTEENLLCRVKYGWISELNLPTGDKDRLDLAI